MKAYFVAGLVFKNNSSIKVTSGSALTTYSITVSGINLTTGQPITSGVDEVQNSLIKCYPNPLKDGLLKITAPSTIEVVTITSINGIRVKSLYSNSTELNQNLSDLPRGVYIVEVKLTDKSFSRQRIIIK